jgi:hypothetical protein
VCSSDLFEPMVRRVFETPKNTIYRAPKLFDTAK